MIIEKLYSNTCLFDEIVFHNGLNIILGKYSSNGRDINGIGKTTIIDLINLCLLADSPKKTFTSNKYNFLKDHSVSLLVRNNKSHMILTKRFSDINSVYITKDDEHDARYSDADYRAILGKVIFSEESYHGVSDPLWFRTVMNFFIQNDHAFFQRDSRDVIKFINYGLRKAENIVYIYFLLGIDNSLIYKYDVL